MRGSRLSAMNLLYIIPFGDIRDPRNCSRSFSFADSCGTIGGAKSLVPPQADFDAEMQAAIFRWRKLNAGSQKVNVVTTPLSQCPLLIFSAVRQFVRIRDQFDKYC
jgi:hypothetical protein